LGWSAIFIAYPLLTPQCFGLFAANNDNRLCPLTSLNNLEQMSIKPNQFKAVNDNDKTPQTKPSVLLIDDSKLVRISITRVIGNEFNVLEAVDGEDGWEKLLENEQIQVVITDAGMPKLDGFGLISRIRESEDARVKSVPIIMITGAEEEQTDVRDKAFALGVTDFLTKPFDKPQLLARTRAHAKFDSTKRHLDETSKALSKQSAIDPETSLRNRQYFMQRGEQDLAYAHRHDNDLAVFTINIDGFNEIFEKHGKDTADKVVIWIAGLIQDTMRKEDTVARIGKNQFGIIAPSAGRLPATILCDRTRKRIEKAVFSETVIALTVTVSIGLVCRGYKDLNKFIQFVDFAESRATQAQLRGGNRVIASDPKDKQESQPAKLQAPDTNAALKMIENHNTSGLKPFLAILSRRVLPILELANKKLGLEIDEAINTIKAKLKNS
jgi:two-component system cell cycle response regulator